MSYHVTCYAVIGCLIKKESLYKTVYNESCDHKSPKENKFCHICGIKNEVIETKVFIDEIDDSDGTSSLLLNRYKLFTDYNETQYVLGILHVNADADCSINFVQIDDIAVMKTELKAVTEPLGLWNESTFGLYAIKFEDW